MNEQTEQVEGVIPSLAALVGHVAEAERAGNHPHGAHDHREQAGKAVRGQNHRQAVAHGEQGHHAVARQAQGDDQRKGNDQRSQHKAVARLVAAKGGSEPAQRSGQRREQNDQNHQKVLHNFSPSLNHNIIT